VNCRRAAAFRWPAGRSPSCAPRHWLAASSIASVAPRSGGGSVRMRCARGAIAVGYSRAIRGSRAGPDRSSISTRVAGRARRWGRATSFCAPTRRPAFRLGTARILRCHRRLAVRSASSTNTSARVLWPIWRPGTFIGRRCSDAANAKPGFCRSGAWSRRSWARSHIVRPTGCSWWSTMAHLIAAKGPLTVSAHGGQTSYWSTRPCMPVGLDPLRGSSRSRSTCPSSSASCWIPTTSKAWPTWNGG